MRTAGRTSMRSVDRWVARQLMTMEEEDGGHLGRKKRRGGGGLKERVQGRGKVWIESTVTTELMGVWQKQATSYTVWEGTGSVLKFAEKGELAMGLDETGDLGERQRRGRV
ncbi:hypothetical protein EMCG_03270 [[Emmonsia] crescens]|uniref:Uncharacterized protein n=1 Tax=[Emmonsia] crescens TaxID=73230 RepID=A0A0G2HW32_9EURO|nr:hypothetical protein EMCG_03270 [Emmonsia crescens UAMH 3008]